VDQSVDSAGLFPGVGAAKFATGRKGRPLRPVCQGPDWVFHTGTDRRTGWGRIVGSLWTGKI